VYRIDCILHKAAVRRSATAAGGCVLPWTDIITACIDYQLVCLRYHKVCSLRSTLVRVDLVRLLAGCHRRQLIRIISCIVCLSVTSHLHTYSLFDACFIVLLIFSCQSSVCVRCMCCEFIKAKSVYHCTKPSASREISS